MLNYKGKRLNLRRIDNTLWNITGIFYVNLTKAEQVLVLHE